ncbi:hypothetical protein [Limnoglobus roseus]|uniref:Uncharacterized protein n=1 Tax=Limnoglobus roseus TaxID=2598579 RepID=A0A5C1ABM1_9BACT|nr:hypothetical protein [Limnoglobus roseus]QEL16651.1 hypothetical protein PX52LOC_03612 [Limnoglobus roseus]
MFDPRAHSPSLGEYEPDDPTAVYPHLVFSIPLFLNMPFTRDPELDEGGESDPPAGDGRREPGTPPKSKRSTHKGDAQAKMPVVLLKHHNYAEDGGVTPDPINNNELARRAGVSTSTASKLFADVFEGHDKYKIMCRNVRKFALRLGVLAGDIPMQRYSEYRDDLNPERDDG